MKRLSSRLKINYGFRTVILIFMMIFAVCAVLKPNTAYATLDNTVPTGPTEFDRPVVYVNTYALAVSTGNMDGSSIGLFRIEYEDHSGDVHKHYIFPHDGDYERSMKLLEKSNMNAKTDRQEAFRALGYAYDAWDDRSLVSALQANSQDVFFFQTDYPVAKITEIAVYTDLTAGNSHGWECSGLAVYGVDQLIGSKMTGYVSETTSVSFAGPLMARLESKTPYFDAIYDSVYFLNPSSSIYKLNTSFSSDNVYSDTEGNEYILKLDIADVYGAGIESFVNNSMETISNLHLPEVLNLEVTYTGTDNTTRSIDIPMITSTLVSAMEELGENVKLVDFAGQGESLAVKVNLPYFDALKSVKVSYGPEAALKESRLKEVGTDEKKAAIKNRITSNTDKIAISGISIYNAADSQSELVYEDQDGTILTPKVTGSPLFYYTADNFQGVEVGLNKSIILNMNRYKDGARLEPVNNQQYFLFVVETDTVTTSASRRIVPNITMQLAYDSIKGSTETTQVYQLKELAKNYYGYVPDVSYNDCGYSMNVNAGGRLYALAALNDVEAFTSVTFGLKNLSEEWQISNFEIYNVSSLSKRYAKWLPGGKDFFGQSTKMEYYREINGSKTLSDSAKMFDAPIRAFIQNGEKQTIDFASLNVSDGGSTVDWRGDNTNSMDYEITNAELLGFRNAKVNYQVDVKVANNGGSNEDDGDSGSKNYFYFQLVFENGVSSVVQANQMIEGDRFIAGRISSFNIATNYDYGNLVAVRIMPDDFSEKADPYDKLNIEYVNVTKKENSGFLKVWSAADIGWIGIDYVEEAGENGTKVTTGRYRDELFGTYEVTNTLSGVELQFAVTTGAYEKESKNRQFVGSVTAEIGYLDTNGGYKIVSLDAVQAMYEYANKTPSSTAGNGKRESSSEFMFLENRTNRFTHFINDLSELVDIRLYVYSDGGGDLNISSISAALVSKEGMVGINKWGEYEKNSVLLPLTKNANPIAPFHVEKNMEISADILFKATDKGILAGLANGSWPYTINKDVGLNDDYLNVLVYAKNDRREYPDADLRVTIDYSDSFGQGYRVAHDLEYHYSTDGTVYYSVDNVRAGDLQAIKEIRVERTSGSDDPELGEIIVHQIRDEQIIQTSIYDLGGKAASTSPSATVFQSAADVDAQQRVTVIFDATMDKRTLQSGKTDVAVALNYTSTQDPSGKEYVSSYKYLTSNDIKMISGGQNVDIEFNVPNVEEVTGITVAATGGLGVHVDSAVVAIYHDSEESEEIEEWYSICENMQIINESAVLPVTTKMLDSQNTLVPVQIGVTTGLENGINTGTQAPIRMIMQYRGFDEEMYEIQIPDIRKYTVSGDYSSDGAAEIELILQNVAEIYKVSFEPYDDVETNTESWKIGTISIRSGVGSAFNKVHITLDGDKAFAYENSPVNISFKKIIVNLAYYDGDEWQVLKNSTGGCIIDAGSTLNLISEIENSSTETIVKAYEVNGDSRRDVTDHYMTIDRDVYKLQFRVPKKDIQADTTFEIVLTANGLEEYQSVLTVVVKPVAEEESEEDAEETESKETESKETVPAETTPLETAPGEKIPIGVITAGTNSEQEDKKESSAERID